MSKRTSSGLQLLTASVLAVVACIGLLQVPQPWRGMLVLWLCGAGALATLLCLTLRPRQGSRAMQSQQSLWSPGGSRRTARLRQRRSHLRVITGRRAGGAQRILR